MSIRFSEKCSQRALGYIPNIERLIKGLKRLSKKKNLKKGVQISRSIQAYIKRRLDLARIEVHGFSVLFMPVCTAELTEPKVVYSGCSFVLESVVSSPFYRNVVRD